VNIELIRASSIIYLYYIIICFNWGSYQWRSQDYHKVWEKKFETRLYGFI